MNQKDRFRQSVLTTERLELYPITTRDREHIFREFNTKVIQYMFPPVNETIEQVDQFIAKMQQGRAADREWVYTIWHNRDFIGVVGLHGLDDAMPELGIWTKLSAHGHHYGREAVGGVIKLAKQLGYQTLIYPVDERNIASLKIPAYFGGQVVDRDVLVTTPDGRTLREVVYHISLEK